MQKVYDGTTEFTGNFTQKYTYTLLRRTQESKGSVKFKKPGLMRWDYAAPAAKSFVVDGKSPITNFAHYSGVDDLIEQARAETDPEAQAELWKEANIQILKDLAAIPLYMQNLVYARQQGVDYGHELVAVPALYPGINETTTVER